MTQALDDLKKDVATLISTATDTIKQLVDKLAATAGGGVPSPDQDAEISALSADIKSAIDNLNGLVTGILLAPVGGLGGSGQVVGTVITPNASMGEQSPNADTGHMVGPDSFKAAG